MENFTIGIDPGISGALALLQGSKLVDVWDMPVTPKLNGKGNEINAVLLSGVVDEIMIYVDGFEDSALMANLEVVNAMPGQGVSSCFGFGRSFGVIEGVFVGRGVQVSKVRPQQWKKKFGLLKKEKDAARGLVLSKYPERADLFRRKKDCDRADAILIGLYRG